MNYLLVFLGGGIGSMLRHMVNVLCARAFGIGFPFGTLTVNITGSIVMGLFAGYFAFKGDAAQSWRLFLMTGILGGYTTFSAFSLDTMLLYERGELGLALGYVAVSVAVSVLGLFAGLMLMRQFA
ncbi:camphor resistance protein CrcB [Afipia sp. P52-10]|jgi:CrcB protein|uniref:fluoride efflux transporter CrcB n=1 Tax=Afipia sp. P52-10 TaxID=1429916 RepID=UPI0003DF2F14|nr:fluoride efflux transporter CrcB [Afipia sp. P52-10]ETR77043.1 camphor resistance protein CrcB [Afipia sp. P52-10]